MERLKVGRLVKIVSGEFSGDIGQIIHVYEEERNILVKLQPRIDYEGLEENCVNSQTRLNSYKDAHYRAPQALFNEEKLRLVNSIIEKDTITFGSQTVEVQIWDSKKFYGRYQYVKFPLSQIVTWCFNVPVEVAKTFKNDIFGEEHKIARFDRALKAYLPEETQKAKRKKITFFPSFESMRPEEPQQPDLGILPLQPPPPPPPSDGSELPIAWLGMDTIASEPSVPRTERTYTKTVDAEEKPPPVAKEKEKPKEKKAAPPPFSRGNKVVPINGPYAGIPCRVDSIEGKVVKASFMSKVVFRIPKNEMTLIKPSPLRSKKSVWSQTEESMKNTPCTTSSGHIQPKKLKYLFKEEGVQCSGFSIFKPRVGDLAQLTSGQAVCVISETECIDNRNRRYSINEIDGSVTMEDESRWTDFHNKRINVGEKVKLIDEKQDKRMGTVLHIHGGFLFVRFDDKIISVNSRKVEIVQVDWYNG